MRKPLLPGLGGYFIHPVTSAISFKGGMGEVWGKRMFRGKDCLPMDKSRERGVVIETTHQAKFL